jgi:hypothetical protein
MKAGSHNQTYMQRRGDALQAEVDALKRLQAETAVNNTGQAACCDNASGSKERSIPYIGPESGFRQTIQLSLQIHDPLASIPTEK